MSIKTRATIEDLYKVEGNAELVNGEIVEMPPAGDEPNGASLNIAFSLRSHEKRTGRGRAYGDGTGFHVNLPHRGSFGPDAAYHLGPRTGMRFLEGAPVFAVEVRSETTTDAPLRRKSGRNVPTTSPVAPSWYGTWTY